MEVNDLQEVNELLILVTLVGINIEVNEQFKNALIPILVTPFGMVTEVNDVQPWNELTPILVTPFGMVTEVNNVQLLNA